MKRRLAIMGSESGSVCMREILSLPYSKKGLHRIYAEEKYYREMVIFVTGGLRIEEALTPSWENLMREHVNLKHAVDGTANFHDQARKPGL